MKSLLHRLPFVGRHVTVPKSIRRLKSLKSRRKQMKSAPSLPTVKEETGGAGKRRGSQTAPASRSKRHSASSRRVAPKPVGGLGHNRRAPTSFKAMPSPSISESFENSPNVRLSSGSDPGSAVLQPAPPAGGQRSFRHAAAHTQHSLRQPEPVRVNMAATQPPPGDAVNLLIRQATMRRETRKMFESQKRL